MTMHPTIMHSRRLRGFSLVELMIGITLGLMILLGVTAAVVSTSKARKEMERNGQQIENGRYAVQLLTDDFRMAGFFSSFDPSTAAVPAALPDPCSSTLADLTAAIPVAVQGYDNGASAPACLSDVKADTDIVVVRRVMTCTAGSVDCDPVTAGTAYYQSTQCATELADGANAPYYKVDTDTANLAFKQHDCATTSGLWKYVVNIYFVANNNEAGDGIPTLKRWQLDGGIVPLVEGIENLQLEYGLDTSGDGAPDIFKAAPASLAEWMQATSVKLSLLARNTTPSPGHTDAKTYVLARDAAGDPQVVGPYSDSYKRHVYSGSIELTNPAGRRR